MVDFSGRFPPITSQASKVIPLRPFLFTTITSATCDNCDNCDKQHTFCTMTWFGAQHLFYHCSCYPSPTFFHPLSGHQRVLHGSAWVICPSRGSGFSFVWGRGCLLSWIIITTASFHQRCKLAWIGIPSSFHRFNNHPAHYHHHHHQDLRITTSSFLHKVLYILLINLS